MRFCGLLLTLFIYNQYLFSQNKTIEFLLEKPQKIEVLESKKLWATHYYIPSFKSHGKIPFLDRNDKQLGVFADTCHYCKASLEGTVFITDSLGNNYLLNFDTRNKKAIVDCRKCQKYENSKANPQGWGRVAWKKSSGYGEGVRNFKLIPYRSIAVDPNFIPYGTAIFIPSAKGVKIQLNNKPEVVHDGYFYAVDTGSAIRNNHIDIFTGVDINNLFESFVKSNPKSEFKAYIVNDERIVKSLNKLHQK